VLRARAHSHRLGTGCALGKPEHQRRILLSVHVARRRSCLRSGVGVRRVVAEADSLRAGPWQRGHGRLLTFADALQRIVQLQEVLQSAFRVMIEVQVRHLVVCKLLLKALQGALVERVCWHLSHRDSLLAEISKLWLASRRIVMENQSVDFFGKLVVLEALRVSLYSLR